MTSRRLLVWGAGGHGKVVAELARDNGWEVIGFVDSDPAKLGQVVDSQGARIAVIESDLERRLADGSPLPDNASAIALGVGDNSRRLECARLLGTRCSPALIHSRAIVSRSATLGEGSVVFAGAIVNPDARIGRATIINSGAIVEHDCLIEDGAHLSPGAVLTGNVRVGKGSWIGAGATVLPGRIVGLWATVGAGAVVVHDVPDKTVVVGNPARGLKRS